MATTNSPNMNLPVPQVGVEIGPQYATDVNSCLNIVDQHNHSAGSGTQITPAGIDITSDLAMNGNNLTLSRSLRMVSQSSVIGTPTDLNCLSVSLGDLYYNDGVGNQVRITQSGSIVGSSGSISGLVSPASASYVSGTSTFVWQSNTNTPAEMDFASATLRNLSANSFGLTLSPPSAMGSDTTITLPTLPSVNNSFMTMSTAGAISTANSPDNSTVEFNSGLLRVKPLGITATQIANQTITATQIANTTVTRLQQAPVGQSLSGVAGTVTILNNSTVQQVQQVVLTTSPAGRPVNVQLLSPGGGSFGTESHMRVSFSGVAGGDAQIYIQFEFIRNGIAIGRFDWEVETTCNSAGNYIANVPLTMFNNWDFSPGASSTNTYEWRALILAGSNVTFQNIQTMAYEL